MKLNKKYLYKVKNKNIVKKPIPKELWDKCYSDVIAGFIEEFELTGDIIEESEMRNEDYYIRGMIKGMWMVYKMIEDRMVDKDGLWRNDESYNKDKQRTVKD